MGEGRIHSLGYADEELNRPRKSGPVVETIWAIFATVVLLVVGLVMLVVPGIVMSLVLRR